MGRDGPGQERVGSGGCCSAAVCRGVVVEEAHGDPRRLHSARKRKLGSGGGWFAAVLIDQNAIPLSGDEWVHVSIHADADAVEQ